MHNLTRALLAGLILVTCFPAGASIAVPSKQYYGEIEFSNPPVHRIIGLSSSGGGAAMVGFGSVSQSYSWTPSITVHAWVGDQTIVPTIGRSFGSLYYFLEVTGPGASVAVTVTATGSIRGVSDGPASSLVLESSWKLTDPSKNRSDPDFEIVGDAIGINYVGVLNHSERFDALHPITLATNHLYAVELHGYAQSSVRDPGDLTAADAHIDPVFSLADGVDPGLFAIEFSPGILNISSGGPNLIPLPGAALNMLSGVLLLSGLRRKTLVGTKEAAQASRRTHVHRLRTAVIHLE